MTDRDAILALVGRLRQFEGRDWETTVCYNGLRLEAAQALTDLLAERDELQRVFDLRWEADRRATKRWQEETGRDTAWPDHADMVVWLLARVSELEAERDTLRMHLEAATLLAGRPKLVRRERPELEFDDE